MGRMSWTSIQRKGNRLTELTEMENWCDNTIEMKNNVLRTAIDLKLSVESNPRSPLGTHQAESSREWRFEGAPITDEGLLVLLQANGLSIVLLSSVFCPLQKKISNYPPSAYQYSFSFEHDHRISIFRKRKRRTAFRLEMISQLS